MDLNTGLMLASAGLVGLGLYWKECSVTAHQEDTRTANKPMNSNTAHEAMGPSLEGRGGVTLDRAYSSRVAASERNVMRPLVAHMRNRNQPVAELLNRTQVGLAEVYRRTPEKTAFMFEQRRRRPLNQGKIRDRFQVTQYVRQGNETN